MTALLLLMASTPALAANDQAGGGALACSSLSTTDSASAPNVPATGAPTRAPDAIQVAPGVNDPLAGRTDGIVLNRSEQTWTDGALQRGHGVIEVLYPATASGSSGGRRPSLQAGTCTKTGTDATTIYDYICGGGCLYQYEKRSVDLYSNDADTINTYYDRLEVRIWWVRLYSTGIYFTGNAYTRWQDYMVDCNGSNSNHDTYAYTTPSWYTWDRTYDYYWDETWLPTVGGPDILKLFVYTQTPESYGRDLYTQNINN